MANKRFRFAVMAILMLCASISLPVWASAAVSVELSGLSAGSYVNRSSYYELTVPGNITYISFNISLSGSDFQNEPVLRTLISESANHPISEVSPSRISVRDASANSVQLTLTPNTTGSQRIGDVMLSLIYEGNMTTVGNIVVRVVQQPVDGVSSPNPSGISLGTPTSPQIPESASLSDAQMIMAIQSNTTMPQIAIEDMSAALTYKNPTVVSWGGAAPDIRLVIGDVSLLEKDAQVMIPGFSPTPGGASYDVILPPEQVNAILAEKAKDIAQTISGLAYMEDPESFESDIIGLKPLTMPDLPEGTTFSSTDEDYTLLSDDGLDLIVALSAVPEGAKENKVVELVVLYKGVEAEEHALLRADFSDKSMFPVLHEALSQGILLSGGEKSVSGTTPSEGLVTIGGLPQSYNSELQRFIQSAETAMSFETNVPNGIVTNGTVYMVLPADLKYTLTRNGEPYDYLSGDPIVNDGVYRLSMNVKVTNESAISGADPELGDLSGFSSLLTTGKDFVYSFRILNSPTGKMRYLNAPAGYIIPGVDYHDKENPDGKPLEVLSERYFRFDAEGAYTVYLKSESGFFPDCTVNVTIDNSPPLLSLGDITSGDIVRGSVIYETLEPDVTVSVQHDGADYMPQMNTLKDPGSYNLTATDSAGNQNVSNVRILYTLNMSSRTVFILTLLLFAGLGGYMIYLRTHMRVR